MISLWLMDAAALARENALLKARLTEVETLLAELQEANRRLEDILRTSQREKFGKRSEKLSPDQFNLPLEDAELAQGVLEAAQEKAEAALQRSARGRTSKAQAQPWSSADASAQDRARDRACQHALPLRLRRDGEDRRGRVRTARRDPGPVPGAGHAAAQIRLPPLLAGRGAGARPRACRARRAAHGAVHCLDHRRPSSGTTFRSTARPGSSSGRGSIWTAARSATGSVVPVSI